MTRSPIALACALALSLAMARGAEAEDLLQIYRDAVANDPALAAAH